MVWTISLFFIAVGISAQAQIERMMVAIRLSELSGAIQPFFRNLLDRLPRRLADSMRLLRTLVFSKKVDGFHVQGLLGREFGGDDGQGNYCKGDEDGQTQVKTPDSVEDDFRKDKADQSAEGCSDKRSE